MTTVWSLSQNHSYGRSLCIAKHEWDECEEVVPRSFPIVEALSFHIDITNLVLVEASQRVLAGSIEHVLLAAGHPEQLGISIPVVYLIAHQDNMPMRIGNGAARRKLAVALTGAASYGEKLVGPEIGRPIGR
jgi:hypothetical protein